jgi:small-conductance mechanosensitive channel
MTAVGATWSDVSGATRLQPLVVDTLSGWVDRLESVLGPAGTDISQTVLVVVLAYVVARVLVRLLGRRIARRSSRPSLTRMSIRALKGSVYLVGFFAILRIYGLQLSQIALSVTVFTAVLGVVLAPIVGSFISGIFLLADQPFEIGDMIEIVDTGQRGFVEDITLRYTKIFTLDNTFVVIPNGSIRERDVINYSAEDKRTRQSLDIVVTYEGDLAQARRLIEDAAREVDNVITGGPSIRVGAARYPAGPSCYVNDFGDHGVRLTLRYWLEEPYKLLAARSNVQTAVWDRLDGADVEIAYPHSHVVFDDTSGELPVSMRSPDGTDPGPAGHE